MIDGMTNLEENDIQSLVNLRAFKKTIDCKRVFTIKVCPDESIARLKAPLVIKGYAHSQRYGID